MAVISLILDVFGFLKKEIKTLDYHDYGLLNSGQQFWHVEGLNSGRQFWHVEGLTQ